MNAMTKDVEQLAGSAAGRQDEGLFGVFAEQAGRAPAATALVFGELRVSYRMLAAAAGRVAEELGRARVDGRRGDGDGAGDRIGAGAGADVGAGAGAGVGVGVGDLVAITLPRGVEMVAALLGTLKAGAGYVLVDPDLPAARRESVLADTAPAVVVDEALMARAGIDAARMAAGDDAEPALARPVWTDPAAVASVMFTSGSTGRPKGVVVPHRAMLATYLRQRYAAFDASQVWLQCSPVSWDAFALELFGALLHGATCVLAPGQRPDPETVAELTVRHGVTQLQLSASLFNFLVDEFPGTFAGLRVAFTGGEAASPAHVARIKARYPDLVVVNGYGPVESLGFTTCHVIEPWNTEAAAVPIGVPIAAKDVYVLDERLRPVPTGVAGELYCAGDGLAHGYLGQGGLTASRFLPDPFSDLPGALMYRTGDLGHADAGGVLHVAGRADDQVKIRGFRVEPAEIVAAVLAVPGIRQAAVTVVGEKPEARLAAWVTRDPDALAPTPRQVRELLADRLPDYMIPAVVTVLPRLPMTANGKLDTAALPAPRFTAAPGAEAVAVPEDSLLGRIGAVWSRVLKVGPVGPHDDYFALGGHSLNAVRTLYLLRESLSVEIPLRALMDAPNLAEFTDAVQQVIDSGAAVRKVVPLLGRRGTR
ncbi:amino acid adenylation domain-containing protein [Catenulispora sp. GAS73]|uniref:non-ribosomal peptide synthetase n=1 Tax=Catenulispora sp. GAS73 TaxID=3156269 RepID=UPI003511A72F